MTEKGRGVYWTSLMMLRWELKCDESSNKVTITLKHHDCGKTFLPDPACGSCGETIDATQVDWAEGPGVGLMAPLYSRRRQQRASSAGATSLLDQAAQLMGDRWASLIMRSIFTGITRFEDIRIDTGMATDILSERLQWLQSVGVIRQRPDPAAPSRNEYRLTRKGVEYFPVLLMLLRWGDQYYVSPEGPPLILKHKTCGKSLDPEVVCSECRKPIGPADVSFTVHETQALNLETV